MSGPIDPLQDSYTNLTRDDYNDLTTSQKKRVRNQCKILWYAGKSVPDIVHQTGVTDDLLEDWIFAKNGWEAKKNETGNYLIRTWIETNLSNLENISGMTSTVLSMGLVRYKDKMDNDPNYTPSVKDLKDLSEVLSNMYKLTRLAEEKPTEIHGTVKHGLTNAESIQVIKNDPFAKALLDMDKSDVKRLKDDGYEEV